MISTNQFKNGMTILLNKQIFAIVSFQHVKPGKGGAFVRTKLRNINAGNLIDRTFRSGEKFEQAFIEQKRIQFLYKQGNIYHFMDMDTYEQLELNKERLGENIGFLKENTVLTMSVSGGSVIEINLPNFVELKIDHTEPGQKGDTVKNVSKVAILETGAKINIPLFVNSGETVKIDTRTGTYVSRV